MSEYTIQTEIIHHKPDAFGLGCKQAFATRGNFVGTASVQQIRSGQSVSQPSVLVRGVLIWQECDASLWRNVDTPSLTWESTDDELIAAAVQILKQAEGVQ